MRCLNETRLKGAWSIWRTNLLQNADARSCSKVSKMKSFNHTKTEFNCEKTFASNFENVNIVRPEFGTRLLFREMVWEGRNDRPQQVLTYSFSWLCKTTVICLIVSVHVEMLKIWSMTKTQCSLMFLSYIWFSGWFVCQWIIFRVRSIQSTFESCTWTPPLSNPLEILPNYNSEKVSESIDRCIHQ